MALISLLRPFHALLLTATIFWSVNAASAPEPPIPSGLSVSITNSKSIIDPAASAEYVVAVKNDDATVPLTGTVVVTLPDFARVRDGGGAVASTVRGVTSLTWPVTVKGGSTFTQKFTVGFAAIPPATFRASMIANVFAHDGATPIIGSADSDQILGHTDPASGASGSSSESAVLLPEWAKMALVVGLAALTLMLAVLALRARGRRRLLANQVSPRRSNHMNFDGLRRNRSKRR